MLNIRIVCTYDALKTAQTLMRVLAAEGHVVDITYGRAALAQADSVVSGEAIILIWSLDAPFAHYMLHWRQTADPERLIEIARAPGYPDFGKRRAPVIDFSTWGGERAGGSWRALQERLRIIARANEPPRPVPIRATVALGAVSALAVGGALMLRVDDVGSVPTAPTEDFVAASDLQHGLGGPMTLEEPASADDVDLTFRRLRTAQPIEADPTGVLLTSRAIAEPLELREPQLLDRLYDLTAALTNEDTSR
ncbi:MAG: hypothetical protein AB7P07_05115 [Hyphomonadaceae bacterium]